jgi:hypothetical protein
MLVSCKRGFARANSRTKTTVCLLIGVLRIISSTATSIAIPPKSWI